MDLGLDTIRTRGRAAKPVSAVVVAELKPSDLAKLGAEGARSSSQPAALKRLTDRHHSLARMLASGMKPGEAAAILRMDASRVSILKGDPAFQELMAFYRDRTDEIYFDMHEQLAGLSADAIVELRERFEEDPTEFSPSMLMEMLKVGADRTGFGPKSTQDVNVNVGIADRLEAARKRSREKMLELRANPIGEVTDVEPE